MKKYRLLLLVTAGTLTAMLLAFFFTIPSAGLSVQVIQPGREPVYNSVSLQGTVRAKRESTVCVLQPAVVTEVYAAVGETVAPGDPLFRVHYTLTQAGQDALSQAGVEIEPTASEETFYASMAGTIAQLPAAEESLIPGLTAARVGDYSKLTVEVKAPELYAASLSVGQKANVSPIADPDQILSASLTEIAPYAVQTFSLTGGTPSATVACTLALDATGDTLLPGSTVDVKLFTDYIPNAVTVPYAAIGQADGQEYVYLYQDGRAVRQNVSVGYQLSRGVQIAHGLDGIELIVADADSVSADGQQIEGLLDENA